MAEQSIGTASGVAWLTAIAGACIIAYRLTDGRLGAALLAAPFEIFWIIAGWRIRKFSYRWAAAALIVHILNWGGFAVMSGAATAITVMFWEVVFLFSFINGTRATRAYPGLTNPE